MRTSKGHCNLVIDWPGKFVRGFFCGVSVGSKTPGSVIWCGEKKIASESSGNHLLGFVGAEENDTEVIALSTQLRVSKDNLTKLKYERT